METRSDFEKDVDLSGFAAPGEVAPAGLAFNPESGDFLVNQDPVDTFDPRYSQDIEGLLWLGMLTDGFTLYGHGFIIKTLTRGERLAVGLLATKYQESLGIAMAYETLTVAAALLSVDGEPVNPQLSPGADPQTRIEKNFEIVGRWYDPILEALFEKYSQLLVRQAQAFAELQSK